MTTPTDCKQNLDPLKLVREGTSQDQRFPAALDPVFAPVNEHNPAHGMVFAKSYAALVNYYEAGKEAANTVTGDWTPFFAKDVSVLLAAVAIEDIDVYKANLKQYTDYLTNLPSMAQDGTPQDTLGYLYASAATLAMQLDAFKEALPAEIPLKAVLKNLVITQLKPALDRLIAYYQGGVSRGLVNAAAPSPAVLILRNPVIPIDKVGLSADWSGGVEWKKYFNTIVPDALVYGDASATKILQIQYCLTNSLFKSVFDQFLKVFQRVVVEAANALQNTLTNWNKHEPHYALFLAFLQLFEYVRAAGNTLTGRHLDFYYRQILGLKEKPAQASHAHLVIELAKQINSLDFSAGELFKAGKDSTGQDVFFANDRDFVANQAKVAALKTVYRHGSEPVNGKSVNLGRIYASPVSNSDDGLGAPLTSTDQSWQPFVNKVYTDGVLQEINMPSADIGFAIASHHLLMAEGSRWIYAEFNLLGYGGAVGADFLNDFNCYLSTAKGWLAKQPRIFSASAANQFSLLISIDGADPAITPYSPSIHGYNFQTVSPVLIFKLNQDSNRAYAYPKFQDVVIQDIALYSQVDNLKTLAVANDFGPVDLSKPFQPFGAAPVTGSSLILGSKEVFQKHLLYVWVNLNWLSPPAPYGTNAKPTILVDFLNQGLWVQTATPAAAVTASQIFVTLDDNTPITDQADFSANESYAAGSRSGFLRLRLTDSFGQNDYQTDLINYLSKNSKTPPGSPPVGPSCGSLALGYISQSDINLVSASLESFNNRSSQFFHLTPFGTAEQHPYLTKSSQTPLLSQFQFPAANVLVKSEAEFYIGVSGLHPPQNLSLLCQAVDGSANPRVSNPPISWSYLSNNQWLAFADSDVQDQTGGLLNAGIITFTVPIQANTVNTLLPAGLTWIRAAVNQNSDAVCRQQLIAAQALRVSFADQGNSPDFLARPLPAGAISKLAQPDSAVKTITQPFTTLGGAGAEQPQAFYTRISERLRHKDRAISLWDYERLILDAFPQLYKVKCLNHTKYEADSGSGSLGVYRELAPGHVTVVTIPNLQFRNMTNPLQPYTSLALLDEIAAFLQQRLSSFTKLYVKNPLFEEVFAAFNLHIRDGYDPAYYKGLLQQAITNFLSPWAFSAGGGGPSFGGKIYKSALIDFIENQPYVDYVTDVRIFKTVNGVSAGDADEISGTYAISVLVSAPADQHIIILINPKPVNLSGETCSCAV
jgi:hypothetical protein